MITAAKVAGVALSLAAVAGGLAFILVAISVRPSRHGYDDDTPDPALMAAYMAKLRREGREARWVR